QDVAGRDAWDLARPREPLRLRPLTGPWRAEHDQIQRQHDRVAWMGRKAWRGWKNPWLCPASPALPALPALLCTPSLDSCLLHEAVVVPHDQLRLDLLHGVHRHADDDQNRGAAEVERQ